MLPSGRRYDGATDFLDGDISDRGYEYQPGKRIKALLTADNRKKKFELPGAIEDGRAMMTFDADLDIGPQDRITFLDMEVRQELELTRGASTLDTVPLYPRVREIQLLRSGTVTYTAGKDYRLVWGGGLVIGIDWSNATASPTTGARYVMQALVSASWIVEDQPMVRSFGTKQLPKRAILMRDDPRVRSKQP